MSGLPRLAVVPLVASLILPLSAIAAPAVAAPADPFPARIALPDGFQPEGITIGKGATAWFGSRADGDIYQVNLRTGKGRTISEGPGTSSVGLKADRKGNLYVAGGTSGTARVVDIDTGDATEVTLTEGTSFVNDVILTPGAAWFTDSAQAQLYRVDRSSQDTGEPEVTTVPLTGDWEQGDGFGANGITTTPNGRALLIVNSETGVLYRVNMKTGNATTVDTDGASLTMGDGMLRHGRTLYVVRNDINEVAVLRLSRSGATATQVRTITADDLAASTSFDVPTTVARFGKNLYLPNARFGIAEPSPSDEYWVTKVPAKAGDRS